MAENQTKTAESFKVRGWWWFRVFHSLTMIFKVRMVKPLHLSTPKWCKLGQDHSKNRRKKSKQTTQNKWVVMVQETSLLVVIIEYKMTQPPPSCRQHSLGERVQSHSLVGDVHLCLSAVTRKKTIGLRSPLLLWLHSILFLFYISLLLREKWLN